MQLPAPGCPATFIVLRPRTGSVKQVLLEVDKGNLVHFQRFLLIMLAGVGADIEQLSEKEFKQLSKACGWS